MAFIFTGFHIDGPLTQAVNSGNVYGPKNMQSHSQRRLHTRLCN